MALNASYESSGFCSFLLMFLLNQSLILLIVKHEVTMTWSSPGADLEPGFLLMVRTEGTRSKLDLDQNWSHFGKKWDQDLVPL